MAPIPSGVWLNRVHGYESSRRGAAARAPCISRAPASIARSRPASRSARPAPPTSAPRTASCWSTPIPASAASCAPGPAPTARANIDYRRGRDEEMHALRRPHLQRESRSRRTASRPASRPARPARAISAISAIPRVAVSQLVAERGGYDLLPEMGYKPVNKYLPPRQRPGAPPRANRRAGSRAVGQDEARRSTASSRWVDRALRSLTAYASRLFRDPLHHAVRRGLRPARPARAGRRRAWARLELRLRCAR